MSFREEPGGASSWPDEDAASETTGGARARGTRHHP